MTETALATSPVIDLSGLSKPQLRAMDKLQYRKDVLGFLSKTMETGKDTLSILVSNEVGAVIAFTALVHVLWKLKLIDDVQAVALFGLVLGKGVWDVINPFN